MKKVLYTDQEFMRLCMPATDKETAELEKSLIRQGCLEPIIVWKGLILDGHKRYRICIYEDIDFEVKELFFESRDDVIIWICRNRISGLNKYSALFRFLVGKWYNSQKRVYKIQKKLNPHHEAERYRHLEGIDVHHDRVSVKMGMDLGIHRATIERYGGYANALEAIYEKEPALFHAIIAEEVSFKYKEIRELMNLDQKELYSIFSKQLKKDLVKMRYRRSQKKDVSAAEEVPLAMKVKEMPAFDPDMALRGLTLTIPMWISVIARTQKQTDMTQATEDAKIKLADMLSKLEVQIKKTMEELGW